MDKYEIELARATFDAHEQVYVARRGLMSGYLGVTAVRKEATDNGVESAKHNFAFVTEVLDTLPAPTINNDSIVVESPEEVRQVQANAVWLQDRYRDQKSGYFRAMYVAGQAVNTSVEFAGGPSAPIDLLLYQKGTGFRKATVWDHELTTLRTAAESPLLAQEDLSNAEMSAMYGPSQKKFWVSNRRLDDVMQTKLVGFKGLGKKPWYVSDRAAQDNLRAQGMYAYKHVYSSAEVDRMPNELLDRYDVFTNLSRLAMDFGKQNELRSALDRYQTKLEDK